ncbi:MAG: HD domain-containing protein [Lachnospiraceae bacterium]|nr:HD domain-containing protein [Lachnospiraceae bacterium]
MADKQEMDNAFSNYVERMDEVSQLSSPILETVTDADDYSQLLLYNFRKIGELAGENREMIDHYFMPLINKEGALSEDEINALEELNALLIDMDSEVVTNIDVHLAELASERVERERSLEEDCAADGRATAEEARIRALDKSLDIHCQKLIDCLRSHNYDEAKRHHVTAVKDYQQLLTYLEKDRFQALSDEMKELLLVDVYYGANAYDCFDERKMQEMLSFARTILQDDFYRKDMSEELLDKWIFRTYEYAAEMSYYGEYQYEETYRVAYENAKMMEATWLSDPEKYGQIVKKEMVTTLCMFGAVRAHDPSLESRLEDAIRIFEERDFTDYSYAGLNANLDTAVMLYELLEITRKSKGISFPERFMSLQRRIPKEVISYLYRANNGKLIAWTLASVGNLVESFREIPGGMKGGELFTKLIVAMHPPTYVHSCMAAKLSLCLTRHVLERRPELFVDFPGCGNVEAVKKNKDEILDHAYNAALYHDIGKLMILDTIAMYGRGLLDSEFRLLKVHPDNGAMIAERLPSLKPYSDVIRGHHLWYDGSRGYPNDFDAAKSPYKTIIDVVMTADCLDAATDRVGRSYSKGKSYDEYKAEVRDGAGTRYAPWMAEILDAPEVEGDVRYLLDEGRKELYRDTFKLLKDITQVRA